MCNIDWCCFGEVCYLCVGELFESNDDWVDCNGYMIGVNN